ncbi:MAG: Rrf2 family transcriptional regulator [Synergistaceae bacterium]|nr:Rrf2 family transcriptional regulator [Synergistaceae bacterium]
MKISTKGRYALRMLLDIAEHESEGYVALKDVAARQDISKNYLEQIIMLLKNAEMLKTARGFQGGYKLAKPPEQYTVGDILRVTESSLAPVPCVLEAFNECKRSDFCMTQSIWSGLGRVISEYLDGITLQDILDKHHRRDEGDFYAI